MIEELVRRNRSYRGFDESRKITREELEELIGLTRYTASSRNVQGLKYIAVPSGRMQEKVQSLTHWAGSLKELNLPYPGTRPTAFIVICLDKDLTLGQSSFLKDVGITAQTILLAAVEKGLGGCMIGSFDKRELISLMDLPENIEPSLVVALGKPCEEIHVIDAEEGASMKYYRDENNVHYVPKRKLEEIMINWEEK